MRKAYKIIISLSVILIAGLNLVVPAFAQDPFSAIAIGGIGGASGAGLFSSMAGMSGINVGWSNTGSDPLDAMWNVLNPDHVYFSGEKHEANPQSDPEDIYDYIKVDIGDWLQAQSDFIVNFAQTNNVQDNSSGNVSVPPSYHGYYFTTQINVGSTARKIGEQLGTINNGTNIVIGTMSLSCTYQSNVFKVRIVKADGTITNSNYSSDLAGSPIYLSCLNSNVNNLSFTYYNGIGYYNFGSPSSGSGTASTTVPWTSGTVNTNVFNGWESAKVKIPKSVSQLQSGWTVPDFMEELNRLWENSQQVNIVIENGDEPDPPVPPPPVPSTPLGDTAFNDFVDLWGSTITDNQETANDKLDFIGSNGEDQLEALDDINTTLTNIDDNVTHMDAGIAYILQDTDSIDTNVGNIEGYTENIDTNLDSLVDTVDSIDTNITSIESTVGNIDTNIDDLTDTAESIDTNIGIGNGILGGIRSLAQSVVNYLEGIAEHVGELVEEIVEGTETLIAGILNQIPQAFSVIFGPIKQASSIWHYVVEWITSIGAPFQFIWSMASGTSYYVILPVYASLAAAVVLAFFKRFGR